MKLLFAALAAAALTGCAAYVPYDGGAGAYPGYGAAAYPYAYGVTPAYPYYGGSSIYYGATIVAPRPAYGYRYRHHWGSHDGRGDRGHWRDGRRDHPGQRDGSGWHR